LSAQRSAAVTENNLTDCEVSMNRKTIGVVFAVLTFVVGVGLARIKLTEWRSSPTPAIPQHRLDHHVLSGPYVHENLTMYLIHSQDLPNARLYTPLPAALERKLVTVYETGDVNELAIQNGSRAEEILVQAGDIVKGGQQDRVLAVDLIVPARSERIPIDAFCVEQSRWQQRGDESAANFSSADSMVATKELKLATKHSSSQGMVWDEVTAAQEKLSGGLASSVRSTASESSLQLSLEHEDVQKSTAAYVKQLSPAFAGKADVVGVVFVINNQISSADEYASARMFSQFSLRLLRTAAIEAVAESRTAKGNSEVTQASVGSFLADAEQGGESVNDVTNRTRLVKREGKNGLFFETRDMAHNGIWVHRSYLNK
jgi:hypothetical protein